MPTTQIGKRGGRLGALDLLRLFAALSVMSFHFTALISPAWPNTLVPLSLYPIKRFSAYGTMGVPLFFVISGFVVLMSAWGRGVPEFIASRVGRLYPAYWVAAAMSTVLVFVLWPHNYVFKGATTPEALLNLTMFQGAFGVRNLDGVYWTLWYEARFYVLLGLLLLVGITRKRVLAFATLWPIAGAIAASAHSALLTAILMPDFAPFFAGGMLLYLIFREGHDLGTWLLVGVQVAFAEYEAIPVYKRSITVDTITQTSTLRVGMCLAAAFALVALATLTRAAGWKARWMTVAGALTYPLYLLHENFGWYVIHRVYGHLGPKASVLLAGIVLVAAAFALHYLVEKPFGSRLRRATLAMLQRSEAPAAQPIHLTASGHGSGPSAAPHALPADFDGVPTQQGSGELVGLRRRPG